MDERGRKILRPAPAGGYPEAAPVHPRHAPAALGEAKHPAIRVRHFGDVYDVCRAHKGDKTR
jgi:hypothetical protein